MVNVKGVSVVVCCYNSEKRLATTLKHLDQQVVPENIAWEVLIIDNASVDNTSKAAEVLCIDSNTLSKRYRIIEEKKPGLCFAREKGIAEAKYEYIIFCDDDNWLSCNYVADVFFTFESNIRIGIVGGVSNPVFETEAPEWFLNVKDMLAVGKQGERSGDVTKSRGWMWGAGMGCRRSILLHIQDLGFKYLLTDRVGKKLVSGHDIEICKLFILLGYKLYYNEHLIIEHYMPTTRMQWGYLRKLNANGGIGLIKISIYETLISKKKFSHFKWIVNQCKETMSMIWNTAYYIRHLKSDQDGNLMQLSIERKISVYKTSWYTPRYVRQLNKEIKKLNLTAS